MNNNPDPGEGDLPHEDERAEPGWLRAQHQGLGPGPQLPHQALQGEAAGQQPGLLHHDAADLQHARGPRGRLLHGRVQGALLPAHQGWVHQSSSSDLKSDLSRISTTLQTGYKKVELKNNPPIRQFFPRTKSCKLKSIWVS